MNCNFGKDTENILKNPVPYREYIHEDILANKFVGPITECMLGPNLVVPFYSANSVFKTIMLQPPHIDIDFPYNNHCFGVCININLVSNSSENGTHKMAKLVHGEIPESLKNSRSHPTVQPNSPKSSVIIRDFRLWHAGMPNKTYNVRIIFITVQIPAW